MEETFYQKLAKLPVSIRRAIGSDLFVAHMDEVEKKFSLKEDDFLQIKRIIQAVLIKEIPPELFIASIMERIGTDQKTATAIAFEKDIFEPVKQALIEYGIAIDAITVFQKNPGANTQALKMPQGGAAPSPVVDISSQKSSVPPTAIPREGWSTMSPRDPLIKATVIKLEDKKSTTAPVPLPSTQTIGPQKGSGESVPVPSQSKAFQSAPSSSKPLIIQGAGGSGMTPKNIDFHLASPVVSTTHITLDASKPAPAPAPAVVEFEGSHKVAPTTSPRPEESLKKPSLAASPLAASESRKIMEVGASPAPQIIPPLSPAAMPPKPPVPPAHPAGTMQSHNMMPGYISFARPAMPPKPPVPPAPAPAKASAPIPAPLPKPTRGSMPVMPSSIKPAPPAPARASSLPPTPPIPPSPSGQSGAPQAPQKAAKVIVKNFTENDLGSKKPAA
jgi:hypothetical protein